MLQAHAVDPFLLSAGKLALRATAKPAALHPAEKSPKAFAYKPSIQHATQPDHVGRVNQMPRVTVLGDLASKPIVADSEVETKDAGDEENVEPNRQLPGSVESGSAKPVVEYIEDVVQSVIEDLVLGCEENVASKAPTVTSPTNGYENWLRRVKSDCSRLTSSPSCDLIVGTRGICRVSSLCEAVDMDTLPRDSFLRSLAEMEAATSEESQTLASTPQNKEQPIPIESPTQTVQLSPIKNITVAKRHGHTCCIIH